MPESSLNVAFKDLRGDVGQHLGYGRGEDFDQTAWTEKQTTNIDRCVKGGMRRFYFCGHNWSFLRPCVTMTLTDGTATIQLPDDFASPEGVAIVSTSSGTLACRLKFGGIGVINDRFARDPDSTGQPLYLATEPLKGTTKTRSNRQQLKVFPTPDQDYSIQFKYNLLPNFLSGSEPYAYGGAEHAETLLSACKATAEIDFNDIVNGTHSQEFQRLLAASIMLDNRAKPQHFGYNGDRSDGMYYPDRRDFESVVTFEGVEYE
jgi:hypothetical protein